MRKLLLFCALICLTSTVSAQIALTLKAEKTRYLRFEPISVILTVTNISGNTLNFGGNTPDQQGTISFMMDCTSGQAARTAKNIPNPANGLQLAPAQSRQLRIVLNQFYDMQREDSYTVTATLNHGRLARTHISKPVRIEVRDGVTMLSKNIGVPTDDLTGLIKSVQVNIIRFTDIDEDVYCLRIEDDAKIYGVFRLGSFIDGEKPQLELDDSSLIHLLLQIRPRIYVYFIFRFDGKSTRMLQKRFYVSADGAPPTLSRSTGYLRVEHGRLAREGIDYVEMSD